MKVELRERSLGELVGQCYSLAAAHFTKLFMIGLFFEIPGLLLEIAASRPPASGESVNILAPLAAPLDRLIAAFILPIEQAVATLLVAASFTGDNPTLGDCFRAAFRRLGPILALALTVGLTIGFGLMLLLIPGILFMTWYYVSAPALLVENISYRQAMERSKQLSEGHRLSILGFTLVTTLILVIIVVFIDGLVERAAGPGLVSIFINYIVQATVGTVGIVSNLVYYFNLRVKKEAFDIKALSALVDAIAERGTAARGAAET